MLPVAIPATIWLKKRSGFSQGGWAARNAAVGAVRTVVIWPSDSICNSSISQVGASHRFVPLQLLRRRLYHDVPCLKHVAVLGYGESQAHVLLHQEDRCVFLAVDRLDDAEELAVDRRGAGGVHGGEGAGPAQSARGRWRASAARRRRGSPWAASAAQRGWGSSRR